MEGWMDQEEWGNEAVLTPTDLRQQWINKMKAAINPVFSLPEFREDLRAITKTLGDVQFQFGQYAHRDTRPLMPSRQSVYRTLFRLLERDLDVPAHIAESVRLLYPGTMFTYPMAEKQRKAGWDPWKITDPRLSTLERRLGGRELGSVPQDDDSTDSESDTDSDSDSEMDSDLDLAGEEDRAGDEEVDMSNTLPSNVPSVQPEVRREAAILPPENGLGIGRASLQFTSTSSQTSCRPSPRSTSPGLQTKLEKSVPPTSHHPPRRWPRPPTPIFSREDWLECLRSARSRAGSEQSVTSSPRFSRLSPVPKSPIFDSIEDKYVIERPPSQASTPTRLQKEPEQIFLQTVRESRTPSAETGIKREALPSVPVPIAPSSIAIQEAKREAKRLKTEGGTKRARSPSPSMADIPRLTIKRASRFSHLLPSFSRAPATEVRRSPSIDPEDDLTRESSPEDVAALRIKRRKEAREQLYRRNAFRKHGQGTEDPIDLTAPLSKTPTMSGRIERSSAFGVNAGGYRRESTAMSSACGFVAIGRTVNEDRKPLVVKTERVQGSTYAVGPVGIMPGGEIPSRPCVWCQGEGIKPDGCALCLL
ncbi:hypothetical protein QBC39DRAFT_328936 [Podospora conica]|nr:hypothetical protein QBC39DRAFT_328936 [Schizothecium conicum]